MDLEGELLHNKMLESADESPDVVGLFNLVFFKSTMPRDQRRVSFFESIGFQHGTYAWLAIADILSNVLLKHPLRIEEAASRADAFMCNWWLAKPAWMKRYAEFACRAMEHAQTSSVARAYLSNKGFYAGALSAERLSRIFGRDHYTLTPFVFERLPALFFALEGADVRRGEYIVGWLL
ncbi:hypothetical protein FOA52_012817 [Chlamydomonas sp. UWO 241]|nr:hypothetical protein FOA52_012817 [Chlamydomonas sp. UWO 241]